MKVSKQFDADAAEPRTREKAPARIVQPGKRLDPRRVIKGIQRRGLWGTVSLGMAAITCYGTLALVAIMSAMGVSMVVNESIWAGSIIMFAVIACAVVALGMRKHRSAKPLILALAGTGILIYTMYVDYSTVTEMIGFTILAIATYLDFDLRRWSRLPEAGNPDPVATEPEK